MANYHPNNELLMSFAAGQLSNSLGIMVACHLEQCSACRQQSHLYEHLGGELLNDSPMESVSTNLLDRIMEQIDKPFSPERTQTSISRNEDVPRPLRRFIPTTLDQLKWSGMSKSIREFDIQIDDPKFKAKLYKIAAGKELPEHTHKGNEFTYVIDGSFSDKTCQYHEGDFILADTQTIHQPRASMDKDCICFAVVDAPLKMTGFFGRMLNPFMR